MYPLALLTVSLKGDKKNRETIMSSLSCLWDSRATNSMIDTKNIDIGLYGCNIHSNKVEYITATGLYSTTHDVKLPFCMPYCSSSKVIWPHFHVDNNEIESGIGYDMITFSDLMIQLGHMDNFKSNVL